MWILLHQSGVVEAAFWYTLYVPSDPVFPLYRADWGEKETARTLRRVSQRLVSRRPLGSALPADHTLPWAAGAPYTRSPLQAWCFGGEGETLRVLWSPGGRTRVGGGALEEAVESAPVWRAVRDAGP
jgi:hypothetical protein